MASQPFFSYALMPAGTFKSVGLRAVEDDDRDATDGFDLLLDGVGHCRSRAPRVLHFVVRWQSG